SGLKDSGRCPWIIHRRTPSTCAKHAPRSASVWRNAKPPKRVHTRWRRNCATIRGSVSSCALLDLSWSPCPLSDRLRADCQREDKTMSAGKRTSAIAAVCTAIALGTAAGPAQELEQVQTVFEHAIPNIAGKRLIALVVTYPPGGKSPAHRHAGSACIYAH